MNKIVVVGSANIDMMAKVHRLPARGETIGNAEFSQAIGGKGMNQAIAAARLGGDVTFVTVLGNDHYAGMLKELIRKEGISTDYVIDDADHHTGMALIYVSHAGENCIAVAPGANGTLQPHLMDKFQPAIAGADVVVMQAEIPLETIRSTARLAHTLGKKVILNLAPAFVADAELLSSVDVLVVNEVEGGVLSGIPYDNSNLSEIIERLRNMGIPNIVITVGKHGAHLVTPESHIHVPSYEVDAIDTIAAGDTFCGALAVCLSGPYVTEDDMLYANAASAIAVTRRGATTSIPMAREVDEFIARNPIKTTIQ